MAAPIGQQLGNYRLTGLLGQGGFADVYLGEHIHLGTSAAIKVLRTQLSNEDVTNFRTEARTIAHLTHPNIIQVLDFGVEETSGTPFLVMAYAPNGTLRQRHQRGQIVPPASVIAYVKQVAAALQYAHNQKVIHRDIKPENMLVGRNNEILLSDFGIALPTSSWQQADNSGPPDQANWNPVGTVTYMAPEQIQGRPLPASDQYSLAVVAYEWICGVAPFTGSYVEIAVQKMSTPPSPLRAHVPDLPPDVDNVMRNALSIDPQRRFKSIQAFATALEQAYNLFPPSLDSSPIEAALIGPSGPTPLKSEVVTLGRSSSNTIVLRNDPKVSARHAELRRAGRGYCLIDLDSTNGTTLNGTRLAPKTLRALQTGDRITIGDTLFTYEIRESQPLEPSSDGSTALADRPVGPQLVQPVGSGAYLPPSPVSAQPAAQSRPGGGPPTPPPYGPLLQPSSPYNFAQGNSGTIPSVQPSPASAGSGQAHFMPSAQQPSGLRYAPSTPFPSRPAAFSAPAGQPASLPGFSTPAMAAPSAIPQRPTRPWLKTVLIVALIVLLLGSGSLGFIIYHNSLSTPVKTLASFCTALLNKDNNSAWNELSPQFQNQITLPIFSSFFSELGTCSHGEPAQNGSSATTTLALISPARNANDAVTIATDNNGTWKITSESGISGLIQMLNTFCAAMQQGDYSGAYAQLSAHFQQNLTEDQFALFFPKASSCIYASLSMRKEAIQITVAQGTSSGAIDNNVATLLQKDDAWRIDDFNNMPTRTLTAFCGDLQNSNYQDAYSQTSTAFQGGYPEATFASDFSIFNTCSSDPPVQVSGNLQSEMNFALKSGGVVPFTGFLVRDSNNARWKIDSLINFPNRTVTMFCTDLNNKDYQGAYDQLAPQTQDNISESDFADAFSGVSRCVSEFPVQSGTEATSTITYTLTNGSTAKQKATLTELGTNNWKILRLANI